LPPLAGFSDKVALALKKSQQTECKMPVLRLADAISLRTGKVRNKSGDFCVP
jgi:hypothetical protein